MAATGPLISLQTVCPSSGLQFVRTLLPIELPGYKHHLPLSPIDRSIIISFLPAMKRLYLSDSETSLHLLLKQFRYMRAIMFGYQYSRRVLDSASNSPQRLCLHIESFNRYIRRPSTWPVTNLFVSDLGFIPGCRRTPEPVANFSFSMEKPGCYEFFCLCFKSESQKRAVLGRSDKCQQTRITGAQYKI